MLLGPPAPPFSSWALQFVDEEFGYAWWCESAILVSQLAHSHASTEAARCFQDFQDHMLADHADAVRAHGGALVIHDWRKLRTYDAGARQVVQERMRARPRGSLRGSVICVTHVSALVRMAAQAANLVSTLTHGARVELVSDLQAVCIEHRPHPVST